MKDLKSRITARYQGAAFAAPYFDGAGAQAELVAALDVLGRLQSECMDRPILESELDPAFEIIRGREKIDWQIANFRKALGHPDPATRFEGTDMALRLIRRELGQ